VAAVIRDQIRWLPPDGAIDAAFDEHGITVNRAVLRSVGTL
jgi:hypothetical protein